MRAVFGITGYGEEAAWGAWTLPAALVPFGRSVVRAHELNAGMVAADSTIAMRD